MSLPRRTALLLGLVTLAPACEEDSDSSCPIEGEPRMTVTPFKGEGPLDGETTDLPAFPAPQGVPASEINLRLEGLELESITTINVRVIADGLGSIHNTTYTEQAVGFTCSDEGGLFVERLPVNYGTPVFLVDDLIDVTGTLTVEITGETPLTESYPVELRVTTFD